MSDDTVTIYGGDYPFGRRLDGPGRNESLGTIRNLELATDEHVAVARRALREFDLAALTREGRNLWRDEDGELWELVPGYVNPADPKPAGASAFHVADGLIVPMRPAGSGVQVQTQSIGTLRSERVPARGGV